MDTLKFEIIDKGCDDVDSGVRVDNVSFLFGPLADAGGPYAVNEGDTLILDASLSRAGDAPISSYDWDLDGDGQFDDASGVTATFPRSASGIHTVRVKVSDGDGGYGTASTIVTVYNVAPTAHAGGPYTVDEGQTRILSGRPKTSSIFSGNRV